MLTTGRERVYKIVLIGVFDVQAGVQFVPVVVLRSICHVGYRCFVCFNEVRPLGSKALLARIAPISYRQMARG